MYYVPPMYHYPYYVPSPVSPHSMARHPQAIGTSIIHTISDKIKGEAEAIDLYSRLAESAPNEDHKTMILSMIEEEKHHLQELANVYRSWTGREPSYEVDPISFDTYEEGLRKAYDAAMRSYEAYQQQYLLTPEHPVRDLLWKAGTSEATHAQRFSSLTSYGQENMHGKDEGGQPYVVNIEDASKQNNTFRTAIWTGEHLQVTLMSIDVGDDIGLEVHPNVDQFLRIEEGTGLVQMGDSEDQLDFRRRVSDDNAIMVPAGKWHNLTNTGDKPIKLYTIYAPPEHPFGTVHQTKADALAAEDEGY
ncbi:cupin domain-containing protein [Alteribacillus iranensis]|uniref:Mannose-6-phosphate isomerase, cupin superfamily n=1 Tax=Alteribacillus iranensis TaxID=930128 RepID=A0A1I2D0L5_9BACI|nr:cupin domain-containing protein [Alteribacillus iranensis]SFE74066.1 Mannose-6-phosphate isomerase, cupin superfamily [Alteribacillus iranensis]